jgi:GLPGLI family protein
MKRIILIVGVIVVLVTVKIAFGQQEGVITYDIRINMHRTLPPDRQDMKAMIPEFRSYKQQLFFNATESLYKPLIEDEEEDDSQQGRRNFRFRMRMEIYANMDSDKWISSQEFMGKDYLISDSVKMQPWKFGTETKTILGYECKQAFYTDDQQKVVTAWFTDKIRPQLGPDRYSTLPGAVLAVDVNNAERVTVASKVEIRPLKKNELIKPTKGQPISSADFRKMAEERRRNGGGGNRMIIRD